MDAQTAQLTQICERFEPQDVHPDDQTQPTFTQICCTGPILRPLLTSWQSRLDRKIWPISGIVYIRSLIYKSGLQIAKIPVLNQRLR